MDGPPSAVKISKDSQLLLKDSSTAIPPPVMVPKNDGNGIRQTRDPARQAQIAISKITNEKNSVWLELQQQLLICVAPGAMQITSNGYAQVRQSECLGCTHPAPNRSR